MTVPVQRLGTVPTLAEHMLVLEKALAALTERLDALESARDAVNGIDGPAPVALPPNWHRIKQAAALVGYSEPGLRKAIKRHRDGRRWWRYVAGRIFVDVDTFPRRVRT
jgi:hypothetical protein